MPHALFNMTAKEIGVALAGEGRPFNERTVRTWTDRKLYGDNICPHLMVRRGKMPVAMFSAAECAAWRARMGMTAGNPRGKAESEERKASGETGGGGGDDGRDGRPAATIEIQSASMAMRLVSGQIGAIQSLIDGMYRTKAASATQIDALGRAIKSLGSELRVAAGTELELRRARGELVERAGAARAVFELAELVKSGYAAMAGRVGLAAAEALIAAGVPVPRETAERVVAAAARAEGDVELLRLANKVSDAARKLEAGTGGSDAVANGGAGQSGGMKQPAPPSGPAGPLFGEAA